MKQIAKWAALGMAAVAASAILPVFADGDEPEATGTVTLEDNILTLSGIVTNITAEADLGASVTQVVMTAEGGVAFGETLSLSQKYYALDGTGIVRVAEGKRVSTAVGRLATQGHTLVKEGPGTLYFSSGAAGNVATLTRWVVNEGELRIRPNGSFFGGHSSSTNLSVELREGTTYYQEQVDSATTHNPMGHLEMTGAQFIYGPSKYASTTVREGNAAFKGGVLVHASATPSYMTWPRYSHLNHCNPDCVFNIEAGGKLIVDGVLTNGANSAWNADLPCVLIKRGGGELVLLRRNGWTGGTVFEEGTITVADPEALGLSTLTIAGDVTINVPAGVTFVCPPLAVDGTHTLTVTGGGAFTPPATIPDNLTLANNATGAAPTPIVGSTLYLTGAPITLSIASDTIITSVVDASDGVGQYADIVKTGAGTLTLPMGISDSYRNLIVKEGLVSVSAESCFGWGETTVNGGGIRYTANVSQTRTSRPIIYEESGVIEVPAGVTWKFMTNAFYCAKAVVTKTGAGTWQANDPLAGILSRFNNSRWIIHEGKLKCSGGDMFAGYRGSYNIPIEVHEDAVMELSSAYHHLPVRDIILRGGTLYGFHGQYVGDPQPITSGSRWKCWGLNGPITALPSSNGKPSRIVARLSHLAHGDGSATTFDVQDGATLEIDTTLEPGRANSSANPNDGSFIKIGGGTLKLLKPCAAKGLIDIREGTVELVEGGRFNPAAKVNVSPNAKLVLGDKVQMANATDTASAFCASADVWLDASRLSLADGATVSSVPNLGTAGGSFAKFTWTTSGRRIPDLPTFVANGINGKGVLHFNGVQALCLPSYTNKTQYLKVFYVAEWTTWTETQGNVSGKGGLGKWGGPFSFGNRSMTGDDNNMAGVLSYQHGGTTVSTMNTYPNTYASMTVSGLNVGTPYLVSSYLTPTNKSSTVYLNDSTTPQSVAGAHNSDSINKNVNVEFVCVGGRTTTGGAAQVTSTMPTFNASDRMYIGHIGEMLAFTRMLTTDEEALVLAYLKRKWFNSSATMPQETEKSFAGTVRIEVPEGAEASYVANVAGTTEDSEFALTKTGAGTLRYGGVVTGGAFVDVAEGGLALKDGRLPSQVDVWVDASDLSTMTFDAENRVTNLVNKGSAGGSFVRNTRKAAVPFGPTVKEGAEGVNGNPVLAFDGNEALALYSYTNFTAPRSIHVYFVARRTKYEDEGGKGKWGGLFAFGSTTQNGEDQTHSGVCYLSQSSMTQIGVDHGVYSTDNIVPPALGATAIYYFFNTTNGYLYAVETNATSVTAIPRKAKTDEKCEPFQIDILQLGGRLMNYGEPQWYNDGNSRNRFGYCDIAEMIATTMPLGEHQEAELLDYLRKKWMNKGTGSATPPAWLSGIPATPAMDADTALAMADGTSLRHEASTQTLGALVTEGTVDWTRVWGGGTPFPLFSVDGDVSLGTLNLTPDPRPTQAKVLDWTGTLVNTATWRLQCEQAGSLGVTLRAAEKAYWIIPVGTLLILR